MDGTMGGIGSSRWRHHQRQALVEDQACLEARGGGVFTICGSHQAILFEAHLDGPDAHLAWVFRTWVGFRQRGEIRLREWTPPFGGVAYRLVCPECLRTKRKLYAPPNHLWFRCRGCAHLTHRSAHQAHLLDRGQASKFLAATAKEMGASLPELIQRLMERRKELWKVIREHPHQALVSISKS